MEAIACSTVLSLVLAYLSVVPVCRPIVQALGKLRFLSLAGLTFILTVFVGGGHALKLSLLVFGISVFFLTSMLDVVESVTQAEMDYARTLRLSEWRIVWEMRVRGTLGQMFDVLRQTAAMGWVMLTMVEGIVRSEGGIGKMLLDQDKHFTLPAVFAIQAIFLTVGLLQDIFLQWLKGIFARYATLTVAKKMTALNPDYSYKRADVLVRIKAVNVAYDGVPVLRNLTAEIRDVIRPNMTQGQVVALLGPSGIGKTTFFRVMAGLLVPDSGGVFIGHDAQPTAPGRVGVVAQNYPLMMHRTVLSNLTMVERIPEAGRAMLALFDLEKHADKYPSQLSGGQRQRVAIAQQLLCSEHYLVMDEPFSGLDVTSLAKVQMLLQTVATTHEDVTIIVVTHDVSAAVAVADTIWLMGRDRDINGTVIPGARIMEEYDLIEMGLTWHPDVLDLPASGQLIRTIKKRFLTL